MKKICTRAYGKIILMGEHSVVYDKPAIALPFKAVAINVEIKNKQEKNIISIDNNLYDFNNLPSEFTGIKKMINLFLAEYTQNQKNFEMHITSTIPKQRGLGSSAAVSVAVIRGLCQFYKVNLSQKEFASLVHTAESIHHNNPSGIDTSVIMKEEALLFESRNKMSHFSTALEAYLVVADTGIMGNTSQAVNLVKSNIKRNNNYIKIIDDLGALTYRTYERLIRKDIEAVGNNMTTAHRLLSELGVSHKALDHLVETALNNQALGAKMTGSGLGGCMIALVKSQEDAEALKTKLESHGAIKTWSYRLKELES